MLPNATVNVSGTFSNNTTRQYYASWLDVNKSGVGSDNINSGVYLNWTLFDGMKMFATYDKLKELKAMGELNLKIEIENNLASAYRTFLQAKDLLKLEEDNGKLARENVGVAIESFRIGKISTLELKDVQKSFDDATIRLVNARYNAKVAETELMRLNGMLAK